MLFEESFIYFPDKYPRGFWNPARIGIPAEDCYFRSADGTELHAWFIPARGAPLATLLHCHGNAGNLTHRAAIAAAMRDAGLSILLFDYRGYGRSAGRPSEEGLYADGEAAYDHLARQGDVDPARIVLFGESLGGAVACELALRRSSPAALVLESTFTRARDMARRVFPLLPVGPFLRHRLDTLAKLPRIRIPILVVHGDADEIVPFAMGERLFAAANEPKRFHRVRGAGHNDLHEVGGAAYARAIRDFLAEHLGFPPSK